MMIKILMTLLVTLGCSTSIFSMPDEDVDFIEAYQLLGKRIELNSGDWAVNPLKIDPGSFTFKGQGRDTTDWSSLDPYHWLSIKTWEKNRELKDKSPAWKLKLRNTTHIEKFGRVIQCVGLCTRLRGERSNIARNMSILAEGDDFITEEDSYAWIFLKDGSLIRVSPHTSLTFREINISNKSVFYYIRLNYGHIHFEKRELGVFDTLNMTETDTAFYPLMIKEANREYFSIQEYRKLDVDERLLYSATENSGHLTQYQKLNKLMSEEKNIFANKDMKFYIHTPNVSLVGENTNFELFYAINKEAKLKVTNKTANFVSSDTREQKMGLELRGYKKTELENIDFNIWYSVNSDGTLLTRGAKGSMIMDTIRRFVRRIPTLHLAREALLRKHSRFMFEKEINFEKLGRIYGYRLWDSQSYEESARRLDFISENTRRTETTMLSSMKRVFRDYPSKKLNMSYYTQAMHMHYDYVKNRYSEKHKIIRELTDAQYYLWTLKHAKK